MRLEVKDILQAVNEVRNRLQDGSDLSEYQENLEQINRDIYSWVAQRKESGITVEERSQMQLLSKYYSQIKDELGNQRKQLYSQLYQLNSAKKLDSTYSL